MASSFAPGTAVDSDVIDSVMTVTRFAIWALGVVIFAKLTGMLSFDAAHYRDAVVDLIAHLIGIDRARRLTAEHTLQHELFRDTENQWYLKHSVGWGAIAECWSMK
jgi:hypothetical protein